MTLVSGEVKLEQGSHTLHLPYYQAEPFEVGLQFFVKPPGGTFEPFDARDYAAPGEPPARNGAGNDSAPEMGAWYPALVRVLARSTLAGYVRHRAPSQDRKALESRLSAWFAELHRATFTTPAELKAQFGNASIVSAERVVFNIKGNDYRLVAAVDYARQSLYVKWIGTHKEYDQIDVKTVEYQEERYDDPAHSHEE